MKTLAFAHSGRGRHIGRMLRLLQRIDATPDRPATADEPPRSITVLAEAGETPAEALADWACSQDWVHWLLSGVRQRLDALHLEVPAAAAPRAFARRRLALEGHWRSFLDGPWQTRLGPRLLQAWDAVQARDLQGLLALDADLETELEPAVRRRSRRAGDRLLRDTQGARYQGFLRHYRQACEDGRAAGHFLIVWAAVADFFQISLASLTAECLRLEWSLAARALECHSLSLSAADTARWTRRLWEAREAGFGSASFVTGPPSASATGTHGSPP